jgi:cell pole-organizing protein PopZ
MTTAQPTGPGSPAAAGSPGDTPGDPSMEDILASIRRILSEDEAKPASGGSFPAHAHEPANDILMLDASMLVAEPAPPEPVSVAVPVAPPPPAPAALPPAPPYFGPAPMPAPMPAPVAPPIEPVSVTGPTSPPSTPPLSTPPLSTPPLSTPPISTAGERLVAPEAEAATAAAVGALLRHLRVERETATHRSGPTIEDIVREEMRPMLKQWLDAHMPAIVERLVRAEIERVVARSVS